MARANFSSAEVTPAGATRTAVLAAMRRMNKALTVQQIADELGLHTNTVRFHLVRLIQAQLVSERQTDPSGPGRPRMVYMASPAPPGADQGSGYQFLAEILAGHLAATSPAPDEAATAAGEEWGRYLARPPSPFTKTTRAEAVEQVSTILNRLGFAPERSVEGDRLLLHNCPFRTVADHRPGVACSVHLGIMRGALATMEAPVEVTGLERFDTPHPCVARLGEAGSAAADDRTRDVTDSSQ